MSAATVFSSGRDQMGGLDTVAFTFLTFSIIYGWILVSEFQRFLESLFYSTLGLNPRSTIHSLIIFVTMFLLFLIFIWFVDELGVIPAGTAGSSVAEASGGLVQAGNTGSSVFLENFGSSARTGGPIVISGGL